MSEALTHRGPDAAGTLVDGPVALGMRRLSIIDLEGGDQPIANEDGTVHVVQNGEIYNYRELRAELERSGHRLRDAQRHRSARPPLRRPRPALRRGAPRDVRARRCGTRASGDSSSHATASASSRSHYRIDGREPPVRLGARSSSRSRPRDRPRRSSRRSSRFNSIPAPLTILARRRASCLPATSSSGRPARSRASSATPGPDRSPPMPSAGKRAPARGGAPGAPARLGPRTPRLRRPGRRAPLRRRRLGRPRRARGDGEHRSAPDLLDRLRECARSTSSATLAR